MSEKTKISKRKNSYSNKIRCEVFEIYVRMAPPRNAGKLSTLVYDKLGLEISYQTLGVWAREGDWKTKALKFDGVDVKAPETFDVVPVRLPAGEIRTTEELMKVGHLCVVILQHWCENPKKSIHIESPLQAKQLGSIALDFIRMAEVLAGRVSDRKEEEATIDVEGVMKRAQEAARLNMQHYHQDMRKRYTLPDVIDITPEQA